MVAARQDEALLPVERGFVYLPFEHAESLPMQKESVRRFRELAARAPEMAESLDYAERHRAIIERFGRFPHRNGFSIEPPPPKSSSSCSSPVPASRTDRSAVSSRSPR